MALLNYFTWTPWGCCLIISYHSQTFSNRNWAMLSKKINSNLQIQQCTNRSVRQGCGQQDLHSNRQQPSKKQAQTPPVLSNQLFIGCRKTTVQVHWITSLQVRWDLFSDPNNIQSPVLVLWPNEYNQPLHFRLNIFHHQPISIVVTFPPTANQPS